MSFRLQVFGHKSKYLMHRNLELTLVTLKTQWESVAENLETCKHSFQVYLCQCETVYMCSSHFAVLGLNL